jgi:exodeoxyribonuclease-5
VGGYAGTGKTTLIAFVRQAIRENYPGSKVAFAAFTGKAARVLEQTLRKQKVSRSKDSLSTLHSLIYNTELDSAGRFVEWRKKDVLDFDLIIVDEASMVTEDIWKDLLSFKIPVIAVGDHGQLPPVNSDFNLMADPQIKLEKILRQDLDSPIIALATLARTQGMIPPGEYGPGVVKLDRGGDEAGTAIDELLEGWRADQLFLCGYNHTRVKLNEAIRTRRDLEDPHPSYGDRVVCLRNNPTAKLYNGMMGTVRHIEPAEDDKDELWWHCVIELDDGGEYEGFVLREQFGARETAKQMPLAPDGKRGDIFDFGYALTVHKAQGSSAGRVILFEERSRHMSETDWRRWLYTGVTRAEKELFIIG